MLNKNTTENQAKLRKEVSDIKKWLSLIERDVNSQDRVEQLSDSKIQNLCRRLHQADNIIHSVCFSLRGV